MADRAEQQDSNFTEEFLRRFYSRERKCLGSRTVVVGRYFMQRWDILFGEIRDVFSISGGAQNSTASSQPEFSISKFL